jgi:TetR/AcrR family transcriptional regulator, transcriptional repressor for nem operon
MSKGELTRQRILEQTAPLFNKRGFRSAPMSEIMKVTGLQKGGIYNHFRSKEELALEAFDYAAGLVRERWTSLKDYPSSVEAFKAAITQFRERRKNPRIAGGCPLLNSAIESDDAFPALREKVERVMRGWHVQIQKLVSDGKKAGEFRADVDPKAVATVVISCLEGGVLLSRLHADEEHMNRVCDHLLSYVESLRKT